MWKIKKLVMRIDWFTSCVSLTFPNAIVDKKGNDNGLRFVDLNEDGFDDILISNDQQAAVYLFRPKSTSFEEIDSGTEIPRIVSGGKNGGVWFANRHLWVQNEHTHRLPDGVDRRSFQQILSKTEPGPKSPKSSLDCMQVIDGFRVELMAAEPMVMDPIAMEWGFDGKLWVVEMADYPLGLDDKGKPGGRIRYLEDTNQTERTTSLRSLSIKFLFRQVFCRRILIQPNLLA